jgi:single-strand DNA-binding protein
MGHTVTGKLNKAAREFAAGESLGFGINVGVKYYDRTTKQNEWTNYKAVIFSKNQSQIDFLRGALVEGSIVELFGESIKVDPFVKDDGSTMVTLELNNARLGYVGTVGQAPQQQAQGFQPQQQAPQQQMQQAPQQPGFNQQQPNPNQYNR